MSGPTRRGLLLGALGIGIAGTGIVTVQALTEDPPAAAPRPRQLLLGSVLPMSGALAADGRELRDGAALAVAGLNAGGGVQGRQIEHVVVGADVTDADAVAAAVRELAGKGVAAYVHGYVIDWSAGFAAAAEYGAPYLHASSSEEQRRAVETGGDRYRMIFQTTPTERVYGSGLLPLLDRLSAVAEADRRVALVQRTIPHTQAIEDGLRAAAASSPGWSVVSRQDLVLPVTDWTPVLDALAAGDPRVIVVNTPDPAEAGALVRAFLDRPMRCLLYLAGSADEAFRAAVGGPTEGLLWSRLSGREPGAVGERFAADFLRAYGRDPGPTLASATYDAVHVLAAAWRSVSDPQDRGAVLDALARGSLAGVNGGYSFGSTDRTVPSYPSGSADLGRGQPQLFLQDQGGAAVLVDPAPLASGSFRAPPWLTA